MGAISKEYIAKLIRQYGRMKVKVMDYENKVREDNFKFYDVKVYGILLGKMGTIEDILDEIDTDILGKINLGLENEI